jgi:hypothetical protein
LITESILLALADLGSPEEVEKGLRRVLDDHMTESQVRQMVNPTPKIPKPIPTSTPVQPPSDGLKELVIGGAAGALGGFLVANLKRALGTLVRRYMLHALAALGVLAFLGFHGVGNLFKPKTADPSVTNPAPAQTAPEPQAQVPVVAAKAPAKKGPAHLTRGTHAEGQALVAPGHSAGGTGGVPVWAPEGLPLVKDFASRFYNRSYPSWEADQDYLKARMTADYGPVFLKQYYLPAQRVELRDKQEVQGFSNAQPPVVMGGQGNSAQYRVQGQITLQNRSGKMAKNLWTKPVALEISVRHEDGIGCWVEKVTEVTPNQALNAQAGVDPLKAVQDVGGEVSTVADSVAKVDKTKKLLGL